MNRSVRVAAAAGLVFVVACLIRLPLLDTPLERDEGEYAYIAWRLTFGELPYIDWFDQKPPAVFWAYRLALNLPWQDAVSVHALAALFAAVTAASVLLLTRRLVGGPGAVVAGLATAVLSADPSIQGTAANTELFMMLPTVLSCWLFLGLVSRSERSTGGCLLLGVLVGVASTFKQVAAVNWIFFALSAPFLFVGSRRVARSVHLAVWSALGAVMVWGAAALFFLGNGGFRRFLDAVFIHNIEYVRALPWDVRAARLLRALESIAPSQLGLWTLAAAGVVYSVFRARRVAVLVLGWIAVNAVGAGAGGHFFPHYFQQLLPPLAVAAGVAVTALSKDVSPRRSEILVAGALACAVVLPPALALASHWAEDSPEDVARRIYPGNSFHLMPEVARIVEEVTAPDDAVFIFGAEPEVLFYARRRSASRYIFLFPLYGPFSDASVRQKSVARELLDSPPKAVFMMPNAMFFAEGADQSFTRWLMAFVEDGYDRHTSIWLDENGRRHVVRSGAGRPVFRATKELGAVFVRRPVR